MMLHKKVLNKVVVLSIGILSFTIMNVNAKDSKNAEKNTKSQASWQTNWNQFKTVKGKKFPKDWTLKGTKWGVPSTSFYIEKDKKLDKNVLVVDANKSTSTIIYNLTDKVDLNKTPIMRWSWKVINLPKNADGRNNQKDDQVLGIYIGSGRFRQKSIAYRWETETPKDHSGNISYGGGFVAVKWFCVNNKRDKKETWITVERNVAKDYKKAYNFIPKEFAVSIAGNSQYTKSHGVGMVAYIEFSEKPRLKTNNTNKKVLKITKKK